MRTSKKLLISTAIAASAATATPALAQSWNPLDTKPKPNLVVGLDTSVTMQIESDCSDCHKTGQDTRQRLFEAKQDLLRTLPLFADRFAYGGFVYSGSRFAKIRRGRDLGNGSIDPVVPNPRDLPGSLDALLGMIRSAGAEQPGRREDFLPGATTTVSCLTPTANCSGDQAKLQQLINNPPAGLTIPTIPNGTITCNVPTPAVSSIDLQQEMSAALGSFDWPRWSDPLTADETNDLCIALTNAMNAAQARLATCVTNPSAVVNFAAFSCNPVILVGSACSAASTLRDTCTCDSSDTQCGDGQRISACGQPLIFKARQQVAVCYSHQADGPLGLYYRSQPDNVVNSGGCRENALLMFTDGYRGGSQGVASEAIANRLTYRGFGGVPNAYVFRVATPFTGEANQMAQILSNGAINTAYDATNGRDMLNAFATMSNRILRGTYSGAAPAYDRYGTRVAFHIFTVPGPTQEDPNSGIERYLGRPSRIAWHAVNADGSINPQPIWETDWSSRVGMGRQIGAPLDILGPDGTWRNGDLKRLDHDPDTLDRDGDGRRDTHPPVTWGYMLGGSSTQPVIVEAPREIPSGADALTYASFQMSDAIANRPRMLYVLSNGYLHGFHAGDRRNQRTRVGKVTLEFTYDDDISTAPLAGTEIFRHRAPWVASFPRLELNDVVQRDIITGQIVVREVHMTRTPVQVRAQASARSLRTRASLQVGNPSDFATVLVYNQGRYGRGLSALNVSDPLNATSLWDIELPNAADRASSEPMIYQFPGSGPEPVVVMTGGAGGSANVYAFRVRDGSLLTQQATPVGDLRSAPVCLDADGEGLSHCYVVAGNCSLLRLQVVLGNNGTAAFTGATDITPAGIVGGGRTCWTKPAVYFGADNSIDIVYGSGDVTNLAEPVPARNSVWKVVDGFKRRSSNLARATIDRSCAPRDSDGSTTGEMVLDANEQLISPPIVGKGVVAFTTYTNGSSGCVAGTGKLYTFDFETCADVRGNGNSLSPPPSRPQAVDLGAGIHAAPVLLRESETIVTHSSASPTGLSSNRVQTRGGDKIPVKRLYWRPQLKAK